MLVLGWSSEKEATKSTAAANRKKLAAMALPEQKEHYRLSHQSVPPQKSLIFQIAAEGMVGGEGLEPPTFCV